MVPRLQHASDDSNVGTDSDTDANARTNVGFNTNADPGLLMCMFNVLGSPLSLTI